MDLQLKLEPQKKASELRKQILNLDSQLALLEEEGFLDDDVDGDWEEVYLSDSASDKSSSSSHLNFGC